MKLKKTNFKTDQEKMEHLKTRTTRDLILQFKRNRRVFAALERENQMLVQLIKWRGRSVQDLIPVEDSAAAIHDSRNITIEP